MAAIFCIWLPPIRVDIEMLQEIEDNQIMVIFFSATGNTEYIAKQIAERIGDDSLNLLKRLKANDFSPVESQSPFVICSPVYVCEMPRFFADYLMRVELTGSRSAYYVFTSGGYAGIAGWQAARISKRKGMIYMGRAELTMPRNYPVSRRYPMLSDEENRRRIQQSYDRIPEISEHIIREEKIRARYITQIEKLITLPFNPLWVKHKQPADPFHTTDKCIGCGKCANLCPLNNIHIADKRPVWSSSCAHCMACLANCPVEAIEYGDRTQGKPKYRAGKYIDS